MSNENLREVERDGLIEDIETTTAKYLSSIKRWSTEAVQRGYHDPIIHQEFEDVKVAVNDYKDKLIKGLRDLKL